MDDADEARIEGVAWEDLAVLLAGLEYRSLNRAATALQIGQSTASRRIARLEARLGARLFDRLPEGLMPTQFALEMAPHARLIESQMADIERLAFAQDAAPKGRIRLALPDGLASSWLLPELPAFLNDYPGIDLDLLIGHAAVDLVRREADVALRFVRPTAPDLIVKKLAQIPMGAFVHPDLAKKAPHTMRWVVFIDPEQIYLETRWVQKHVAPLHTLDVSLWNALFAAVQRGLGAGLLSPLVAEPAGLVQIATDLPAVPERELFLVYHRALRGVPRVRALLHWLTEVVNNVMERGALPPPLGPSFSRPRR